jgi:hypothetical protein
MDLDGRLDAAVGSFFSGLGATLGYLCGAGGSLLAAGARAILGWSAPSGGTHPTQDSVVIFEHTSRWDFFVMLLGAPALEADVYTLVKPQLFEGLLGCLLGPLLLAIGCLPAPRLEDRGSGATATLVDALKRIAQASSRPIWFCMSPKGTVQPAEWRSGYQRIAEALGWPVRAAAICYETRTVTVGPPREALGPNIEDLKALKDALHGDLSNAVPYRPSRSLVFSGRPYDAFELLAPWDLPVASLLGLVPAALSFTWTSGPDMALQALAIGSLAVAFRYHRSNERRWHSLDAFMAKATLLLTAVQRASAIGLVRVLDLWPTGLAAALLYYAGTPRASQGQPRGAYVIWHSLFHVAAGQLALQLVTGK